MARISTHVLDTSVGKPARGVRIELFFAGDLILSTVTNADGRTDTPLISAEELPTGNYELVFHAGDYFRATAAPVTDPPFLDKVRIAFGVADPAGHYHVPLLVSPYGYTTYRGS